MKELIPLNFEDEEMVFKYRDEPYTTSEVISSKTGVEHQAVLKLIEKHGSRLETYGRVRFEIRPFKTAGGMQKRRVYLLNEIQAIFLITMMRNTERVLDFKQELVRRFFLMRELISSRSAIKTTTRSMTASIKFLYGDNAGDAYRRKAELVNRVAFGMEAHQFREKYHISQNAAIRDFITQEQITRLDKLSAFNADLIRTGVNYYTRQNMLAAFNRGI